MTELVKKNFIYIIGILLGAIGGYLYWSQIGCQTGTCPLQSSPWINILFGITAGLFISDLLKNIISRYKK